jgi:NAD(P)-dependent dehydrogenase (short-subunit alcohol dehydrogenase family)
MFWRYLDEQQVPQEARLQAIPVRMGRPEELVAAAMYLCSTRHASALERR